VTEVFTWPTCTRQGCDHVRSWPTAALADAAARSSSFHTWVDHTTGRAECACHRISPIAARFPCDVWMTRNRKERGALTDD
jgi:hypothetical protein